MELLDMTKEQLIELINTQNEQINNANQVEASEENVNNRLPVFYEKSGFLSSTSSIGLIITDTGGKIISFNKTIRDLLGINTDEYINTNVANLYADPQDRQHLLRMLSVENSVHDFEVEVKHKDGTNRTVLANIDDIEVNDEHLLLTSLYDITQYKQVMTSREETDDRYQALFSNVPVGITVTDFHGNVVVSNNAMKELLGYSAKELRNLSAWEFYLIPADRQQLLDLTKRLGVVRDFETKFRHKNASVITVLINSDIIEFNNKKDMMLTSMRDISGLKQVEDALKKERDFSNAILNIAATLIVVLDRKGTITRFNRACERITGYSNDEIIGTYLWDTDFFDPVMTQEEIDKLLSDKYPGTYENVLVSKNGDKYIISWTFAAMLNQEGHVEYIIATGIDITKRQQAEDGLQKANEELASWVKELQESTEEMNQLNEMGEQLQSCRTIEEACEISTQYIKRICPASHGALYLINNSRDLAEAIEMWGEPLLTQEVFAPLGCWAIRRGRKHLVDVDHPGLRCEHITGPATGQYLCVPLLVNGETIGILHLNQADTPKQGQTGTKSLSYTDHKTQIITTIAEHIALAISNLKLKEILRQQSIRDALTGLFNRRYMEETLERELKRAERGNTPVGVIMFDIDHFKEFNDLAGHDGGDALLRELGAFLKKNSRGDDVVCRYGGEEFLAVLPGANAENSRLQAEKLRRGVKELLVYHLGKPLPKCTISLGVAVFPENGLTGETLLKAADNALYRAKNEGRDRVIMA